MRFFWTFIWALLIGGAISYILTNMNGEPFNLVHSIILSVIFTIAVFLLGEGVLKEQNE